MIPPVDHQSIEIESFSADGAVLLRPVADQKFPTRLRVEGNKSLVTDYPVGTRFKAQVSLMRRDPGGQYLHSSWQWDVKVLSQPDLES